MKKNKDSVFVYEPEDADLNLSNNKKPPPKTRYERTKEIFKRENIKKVIGDIYGQTDRLS